MSRAFVGGGNRTLHDNMYAYYNPGVKELPDAPVSNLAEMERTGEGLAALEKRVQEESTLREEAGKSGEASPADAARFRVKLEEGADPLRTQLATEQLEIAKGISEDTVKDYAQKSKDPEHIQVSTGKNMIAAVGRALETANKAASGPGWKIPDPPTTESSDQYTSKREPSKTKAVARSDRRKKVHSLYTQYVARLAEYEAIREVRRGEVGSKTFPLMPGDYKRQKNQWNKEEMAALEKTFRDVNSRTVTKYLLIDAKAIYRKDLWTMGAGPAFISRMFACSMPFSSRMASSILATRLACLPLRYRPPSARIENAPPNAPPQRAPAFISDHRASAVIGSSLSAGIATVATPP